MKAILSIIISAALVVSGYSQTRNVLVGTNNSVVQPTNFWSADASNARTGLGLGTAATNPASAFQPSSTTLSNLASSNAVNLTNLRATNLVGVIPSSNIPSTTLTNISGTLAIVSGGTGATNASNARVNLGATTVGNNLFTATNAEAARTAIGALVTNGNAIALTNFPIIALASNVAGTIAMSNGGTGATNAGQARTNLGLGITNNVEFEIVSANGNIDTPQIFIQSTTNGIIVFEDATNAVRLRSDVGLGKTNLVEFGTIKFGDQQYQDYGLMLDGAGLYIYGGSVGGGTNPIVNVSGSSFLLHRPLSFNTNANAATSRTNLGLGLPALTNTNNANFLAAFFGANTNPVLVNTNGEVVSPTNFWQVAPITPSFVETQPNTNSTTNITASRFLHIHSLATNIVNVTNTIVLPTNGTAFAGDTAVVVHYGPTSSVTRVRAVGSTNDLVAMNRYGEAVNFVFYNGVWQFDHNVAFVEPIYFSGTNAVANAAASRTNLGLGNISMGSNSIVVTTNFTATNGEANFTNVKTDYLEFNDYLYIETTNTNVVQFFDATVRSNFQRSIGFGPTNDVTFNNITISDQTLTLSHGPEDDVFVRNESGNLELQANVSVIALSPINFNNTTNAATTRTNLGLGATNSVTFSNVTASGTLTATSTVTAKTNLVVEGFVDFTSNHTNATPVTPNTPARWLQIRVGTNVFYLPAHQ